MLLLTVVYNNNREDVIDEIGDVREYFKHKKINIGISESIVCNAHFVKIYSDEEINDKLLNMFNIHMANILYNMVIDEFYKKDMLNFLSDTYFFLKFDEIKEIRQNSLEVLRGEERIIDENSIYCMNKKNAVIDKIVECINENKEININGFITFRMKELKENLESIIDKVVEKYMVEKEYNEFIKLLKYFVEVQESKIGHINLIIDNNGEYFIQDENGKNITEELFSDLSDLRYKETTNMEDILISVLITNSPEKITIHCAENCRNNELIETIKKVFTDRVNFCDECNVCKEIKGSIHRV
ncbi:putative sporulation protein YtxC [Clostridiaceae bacterium UIB06]|uniref:Sporulation protein YtxC n=1 Tax=Clostridium thailandense TaxID=2794346 RepID=A0A949TYE5_9CLOT|nr:putative sporulation protein YtxC [Clostridium thailandense]MBV7272789.1 putative sporulation protein YtxC [Clostridium thailandense]MCH5137670.1 putative sporulation protein YtxC [Clostridiaceae bacterium UIB06]